MEIIIDKIIKTKTRKQMRLEINTNQEIILRANINTTQKEIEEFVSANIDWIKNILKHNSPKFIRKYENGELFLFLGQKYPLEINDSIYRFNYNGDKFIISKNVLQKEMRLYFEKFYKSKARKIIKLRVYDIAHKLNIKFDNLRITSATTRWGSCNNKGNVNFSWRLIMATPQVIDYVIIHEFCHLFEFNHSKKFWELVASIMPLYKVHKKWLDDNSRYMVL